MDAQAAGVAPSLELFAPTGIPQVGPGDDLAAIVLRACAEGRAPALRDGDVVVVAQKVVSKSENRYVRLDSVAPSARARHLSATFLARAGSVTTCSTPCSG